MKTGWIVTCMLGLAAAAAAQANPPVAPNLPPPGTTQNSPYGGNFELFLGGSYQAAKATSANSVGISTTNVPGAQLALRYHVTDFNAIEFRYALAQPTQTYGNLSIKSRASEFTFDYAWTYPSEGPIRPFLLGGLGVLHYLPIGSSNPPGTAGQSRFTLVYGGGLDLALSKQWSIRVAYRGLIYRVPDFSLIGIHKWNHMPEPALGIVFHF